MNLLRYEFEDGAVGENTHRARTGNSPAHGDLNVRAPMVTSRVENPARVKLNVVPRSSTRSGKVASEAKSAPKPWAGYPEALKYQRRVNLRGWNASSKRGVLIEHKGHSDVADIRIILAGDSSEAVWRVRKYGELANDCLSFLKDHKCEARAREWVLAAR
ncbi:hypothetical protein C8F04DRAFT_1198171 [Mycena alexandri]|uniref:Uncharacterized protein n=1 Tax=Mycena alexandri TaxID=1745969 RepID=A0AAD6WN85_9AGAR|nr:hypothetical protein C8F04DRAFT_1198171 [Mycena alexandri]